MKKKTSPTKTKEPKEPAWPPFPEIRTERLVKAKHPHRFRFRWKMADGRKRQHTQSLVRADDVPTIERMIRAHAARGGGRNRSRAFFQ